jgi:hypothetical protein
MTFTTDEEKIRDLDIGIFTERYSIMLFDGNCDEETAKQGALNELRALYGV